MPEERESPPESLAGVDLSTAEKFGQYVSRYPSDYYRALIFHLRSAERDEGAFRDEYEKFRADTIEVISGTKDKKVPGLMRRVQQLEKIIAQLVGGVQAAATAPQVASPGAPPDTANIGNGEADGPGYAPIDNLPFPTSGPLGSKPRPTVAKAEGANGAAAAGGEPQGEGQTNSTVVDVKATAPGAQGGAANVQSRVTNISPIPQGKAR